jgi:hypothetical protein
VSVHEEVSPSTLRINLRRRGHREISEFELTRFGKVGGNSLAIEAECFFLSDQLGVVIVNRYRHSCENAPVIIWSARGVYPAMN